MKGRFLLFVLLAAALSVGGCHGSSSHKLKKTAATEKKKEPKIKPEQENADVSFDAFLGRLRKAVTTRDLNTIASMMTPDFGYSLEPERSGEGVFKYWDENSIWPELEGVLAEKFVKKFNEDKSFYMVAPAQFGDASLNYQGYRAGIRQISGSWKFAYFVNG